MLEPQNDPRAGLKLGSRTAFTFFCNVLPGHEKALREFLAGTQGSPEADAAIEEIRTLHEFRWVMFDDDRRLIFCSSFDGAFVKYIQDFGSSAIGQAIDGTLQHVEGWIGIKDPRAPEWFLEHAVPAVVYNSAYPQPTVKQVWQALALQEAFQQVLDTPAAAEVLRNPVLKPLQELAAS
jgi:hypothetical protein